MSIAEGLHEDWGPTDPREWVTLVILKTVLGLMIKCMGIARGFFPIEKFSFKSNFYTTSHNILIINSAIVGHLLKLVI